jgi:hypothetical protein
LIRINTEPVADLTAVVPMIRKVNASKQVITLPPCLTG